MYLIKFLTNIFRGKQWCLFPSVKRIAIKHYLECYLTDKGTAIKQVVEETVTSGQKELIFPCCGSSKVAKKYEEKIDCLNSLPRLCNEIPVHYTGQKSHGR